MADHNTGSYINAKKRVIVYHEFNVKYNNGMVFTKNIHLSWSKFSKFVKITSLEIKKICSVRNICTDIIQHKNISKNFFDFSGKTTSI